MRAAIYLRISKDQTGEALGVTRQLEDCKALAEGLGWTDTTVYSDNDISATSGKARPSYKQMLADIEAGKIQAIVAWSPDRIYRRAADLETLIPIIEASGVTVRTVKAGDLDLSSAYGRMIARILGAIATGEGEVKSERWKRSWRQQRESGAPITAGRRMFGYTRDNVVIDEEANIAREAAQRLLSGDSIIGVCRWMEEQGIPATGGRPWRSQTLKQYLTNPRIAGYATIKRDIIGEGAWEPVLDRQTWESVRALLTSRTRPSAPRVAVLNGLLFCGRCGTRLITGGGSHGRNYRCTKRPDVPGCDKLAVNAMRVEEIVEDFARQMIDNHEVRLRVRDLQSQPSQVQSELGELEMRVTELERQLDEPGVPVTTILRAIERTRERQENLLDQLASAPPTALPIQGGPWPDDLRRRRALIDLVIKRVDIQPYMGGGNVFNPERIQITPR